MNRTHPCNVFAAALLALLAAGFYSAPAFCCDVDGTGTAKHVAAPMPAASAVPAAAPAVQPAPAPAAAPRPAVIAGGAAPTDDAGNSLGDGVGASPGTHRRGLRWQSFLPGVIK